MRNLAASAPSVRAFLSGDQIFLGAVQARERRRSKFWPIWISIAPDMLGCAG